MKTCPICKAAIQEEARFCLYCMTSFEEKQPIDNVKGPRKQRRAVLLLLCAVLLLVAAGVALLAANGFFAVTDPVGSELLQQEASSLSTTTNPVPADPSSVTVSVSSQPAYRYEPATIENTFPAGYNPLRSPENAIVITGVTAIADNGHYVIPETIDGQRVVAVMPSAFCDPSVCDTVSAVTLPKTVRSVPDGAFESCENLTDVYLACAVVDISENAFPPVQRRHGTLTLHAARDCRNYDFYYYRNIADRYGAVYEEWSE